MPTSFFASGALPLICFYCGAAGAIRAESAPIQFRSGPAQVALIELYTSEGCSSCPPAEKWLGELRQEKGLWRDFVPVAFHVNYWDHLGWRDALASKSFTEREYAYAASWNAGSVYTPCFVRDGAEWRPRDPRASAGTRGSADAGTLTLAWQAGTNLCQIDYRPAINTASEKRIAPTAGFDVSVALLGSGIVNQVRKGENAGRELRHEFVALRLEKAALERDADGVWSAKFSLPPRPDLSAPQRAVAAWVTRQHQLAPIQAAGGWIDGGAR